MDISLIIRRDSPKAGPTCRSHRFKSLVDQFSGSENELKEYSALEPLPRGSSFFRVSRLPTGESEKRVKTVVPTMIPTNVKKKIFSLKTRSMGVVQAIPLAVVALHARI